MGEVWLGDSSTLTILSYQYIEPHVDRFLTETLPSVLSQSLDDIDWHLQHRCEWCDYFDHCRSNAEDTDDLSRIAGLTLTDKTFLRAQFGVIAVHQLPARLKGTDSAEALASSASLRGRRVELKARAQALIENRRVELSAASPSMPKRQDFALHLVLVPDNLNRGVAMAGYLLAASGRNIHAIFGETELRPRVDRSLPGLVAALHDDLAEIAGWNKGREWNAQVSVMPFVYSNRERELLTAMLLELIATPSGPREKALDILMLLHGSELVSVPQAGDQPAQALPVVVVASEVSRLFALPAPVSPTFPEVITGLFQDHEPRFAYPRHDLYDFPFGLALRDEVLHRKDSKGTEGLASRIKQRLFGLRALVWRVQKLAGDRLPTWPPKFSSWSGSKFEHSELAQLAFVARYESVADCEKKRATRFQSGERLAEGDGAVKVNARMDGWVELQNPAGRRINARPKDAFWMVYATESGLSESWLVRDYYFGLATFNQKGGLYQPPMPNPTGNVWAVEVEEETEDGARVRLKPKSGSLPDKGQFYLFPRFNDWNTARVVRALRNADTSTDSLAHSFLTDPATFAAPLALPANVASCAELLATKTLSSADQWRAMKVLLGHRLMVLIGPPGTGKTFTLARLVSVLAQAHAAAKRTFTAFITAFTHAAIDKLYSELELAVESNELSLIRVHEGSVDDAAQKATHQRPAIVCATPYSLLRSNGKYARFDLIVIDESSQVRLAEAVLSIDRLTPEGRLVLCGDNQQLGPIFHGIYPEIADGRFDPTVSVFTHALRALERKGPGHNHPARAALTKGRRMNDVLTSVRSALIYRPELSVDFEPATQKIAKQRLVAKPRKTASEMGNLVSHALDPEFPLVVIEVDRKSQDRESPEEAKIVGAIGRSLAGRLSTDELYVVSPHHVQIAAIRRELPVHCMPRVDTVEKMQGGTCEVVIISYGVSDPEVAMTEGEFIFDRNRLNVALSRARTKAILVFSKPLLEAPPRIVDSPHAAKGYVYLRDVVTSCKDIDRTVPLRLNGRTTAVRLRGLKTVLLGGL